MAEDNVRGIFDNKAYQGLTNHVRTSVRELLTFKTTDVPELVKIFGGKNIPSGGVTDEQTKELIKFYTKGRYPGIGNEVITAMSNDLKTQSPTLFKKATKVAVEFDVSTLSPADRDEIKAFQNIRNTLFPDGNIPTRDVVEAKINSGKFTVRDAYLAKMYSQGMDTAPLVEEFADTKDFAKKFKKAFSLKRLEAAAQPKGFAGNLLKALEKVSLDDSYDEVGQLLKDRGPLNTAIDKVKKGKFPTGIKGTQKLGAALGKYTPELIQAIGQGISLIPDPNLRAAVVAQLFGSRQVDIFEMRTTKQLAQRGVQKRPYFDPETGEQVNPERASRKKAGPTKVMPPVTAELMKKMYSQAGATGELFPNLTNKKIDDALKKYVFKNIPKNILDRLDKAPSTFTDLRRITAAFVLNQLKDPQSASEIISHTGNLDDKIDKVMLKFYADKDDTNILKRTQGLILFEKELAKGLGVTDAKQLGDKLKLDLPVAFNADYPEVDLTFDSEGKAIVETRSATDKEIKGSSKIKVAQDFETEQGAFLRGEQKRDKGLTLAESNIARQKKVDEERAARAALKAKPVDTKPSALKEWATNNADKLEEERSKGSKRRFSLKGKGVPSKLLGGAIAVPFLKMAYDDYKSDYISGGDTDGDATKKAVAMTLADLIPHVMIGKMFLEPSSVAAAERNEFEEFKTKEQTGQEIIDISKERTFREDLSPQVDDELQVQKQMNMIKQSEDFRSEAERKSQLSLEEQIQQLQ